MIKAADDIEVRKINPCYTSQVCSCCGHWEEGQRIDQSHFKCKACGAELNADFNAVQEHIYTTILSKLVPLTFKSVDDPRDRVFYCGIDVNDVIKSEVMEFIAPVLKDYGG